MQVPQALDGEQSAAGFVKGMTLEQYLSSEKVRQLPPEEKEEPF